MKSASPPPDLGGQPRRRPASHGHVPQSRNADPADAVLPLGPHRYRNAFTESTEVSEDTKGDSGGEQSSGVAPTKLRVEVLAAHRLCGKGLGEDGPFGRILSAPPHTKGGRYGSDDSDRDYTILRSSSSMSVRQLLDFEEAVGRSLALQPPYSSKAPQKPKESHGSEEEEDPDEEDEEAEGEGEEEVGVMLSLDDLARAKEQRMSAEGTGEVFGPTEALEKELMSQIDDFCSRYSNRQVRIFVPVRDESDEEGAKGMSVPSFLHSRPQDDDSVVVGSTQFTEDDEGILFPEDEPDEEAPSTDAAQQENAYEELLKMISDASAGEPSYDNESVVMTASPARSVDVASINPASSAQSGAAQSAQGNDAAGGSSKAQRVVPSYARATANSAMKKLHGLREEVERQLKRQHDAEQQVNASREVGHDVESEAQRRSEAANKSAFRVAYANRPLAQQQGQQLHPLPNLSELSTARSSTASTAPTAKRKPPAKTEGKPLQITPRWVLSDEGEERVQFILQNDDWEDRPPSSARSTHRSAAAPSENASVPRGIEGGTPPALLPAPDASTPAPSPPSSASSASLTPERRLFRLTAPPLASSVASRPSTAHSIAPPMALEAPDEPASSAYLTNESEEERRIDRALQKFQHVRTLAADRLPPQQRQAFQSVTPVLPGGESDGDAAASRPPRAEGSEKTASQHAVAPRGDAVIRKLRERREHREKLSKVNSRLLHIQRELDALFSPPFTFFSIDPGRWEWPSTSRSRAGTATSETTAGANDTSAALGGVEEGEEDIVIEPPPEEQIQALIAAARIEQQCAEGAAEEGVPRIIE